jgi:glycosyltransferase involved in cell wall biosynthesis
MTRVHSDSAAGSQPRKFPRTPLGLIAYELRIWRSDVQQAHLPYVAHTSDADGFPVYPIDMEPFLTLAHVTLDAQGIPLNPLHGESRGTHEPTLIAQYALVRWNTYLASQHKADRDAFLTLATWLLEHELPGCDNTGYWLVLCARPAYAAPAPSLSALTQGIVASVLVRAYRLLGDQRFLDAARRAVRLMAVDILDGGVTSAVDSDGVFFEEVAVYPAARILSGHLFALLGLYDYHGLTGDPDAAALIARGLMTLHDVIDGFDAGFWSRYDQLTGRLATPAYHALHITQLQVVARLSGSTYCAEVAARWNNYRERPTHRLRLAMANRVRDYSKGVAHRMRRARFGHPARPQPGERLRVCVPITAFPFSGGMRTIMAGMETVMADEWDIEYLTRVIGPNVGERKVVSFGWPLQGPLRALSMSSHFPNVLLYGWLGRHRLLALLRDGRQYHVILPQDTVFTGAFAGRVGKRAGIRVVSIDHGNTAATFSSEYRKERVQGIAAMPWYERPLEHLRLALYLRTLRRLAHTATRTTDRFLSPSDQSERAYREQLGVSAHRIVRYAGMIDVDRFAPVSDEHRQRVRQRLGAEADALVLTLVGRLAPEKGLEFAVPAISAALHALPAEQRPRVRIFIGGDGPLRSQLQTDLAHHQLTACTTLLGELSPDEVAELLRVSDVFLYAGTRAGAGPQVVFEAMAAGCAVIASTQPPSVAELLGEGRGIAVPPGSVNALRDALVRCLQDRSGAQQMGRHARAHVATQYTAQALRRSLLRATYFAPAIAFDDEALVSASRAEG